MLQRLESIDTHDDWGLAFRNQDLKFYEQIDFEFIECATILDNHANKLKTYITKSSSRDIHTFSSWIDSMIC
jgi:hypothetical protein